MKPRTLLVFTVFMAFLGAAPLYAQTTPKSASITAFAVDAGTIQGGNMTINLWGVEPATAPGTMENHRARVLLDDLIAQRTVKCVPMSDPVNGRVRAQCLNAAEKDLALQLISAGAVAVSRRDVLGSDLAKAYLDAEQKARTAGVGIWGNGTLGNSTGSDAANSDVALPGFAKALPMWAIAAAMLLVPLLGFLVVAIILYRGFKQMIALQRYQLAGTQKREKQLKDREKYVIASALEGEINTNRAKLDAFLVIYEELLKSLRDPSKKPKYQRAGDIIHEKPALSRTVYDSHIDKLDVLGPQITSDLSNLYGMIDAAPDYRTLEPEVPIEKAREIVDRIIRAATKMADPMDKALAALSIIVRDKRGDVA